MNSHTLPANSATTETVSAKPKIRPAKKVPKWLSVTLVVGILLVSMAAPQFFMITATDSLAYNLWLRGSVPPVEEVTPGQFYTFEKIHPWTNKMHETSITKEVACGPGGVISISPNREYFCNGALLGVAIEADSKGVKLERSSFQGVIPPGHYFMVGTNNPRSWDSKYYGLIRYEELKERAFPIL